MTKTEAVRQAMVHLGTDAMPVAIRDWVRDNLGIEMTAGHASTTKGEILRKRAATTPKPREAPNSKKDAVRKALAELGNDATRHQTPEPQVQTAPEKPTVEEPSQAKPTKILREAEEKKAATEPEPRVTPAPANLTKNVSAAKETALRKMAAMPEPQTQEAPPANGKTVLMADILKLRDLVERVGADNLHTLIGAITGR